MDLIESREFVALNPQPTIELGQTVDERWPRHLGRGRRPAVSPRLRPICRPRPVGGPLVSGFAAKTSVEIAKAGGERGIVSERRARFAVVVHVSFICPIPGGPKQNRTCQIEPRQL